MNTRHLLLTVAFGIGILGSAPARAQDSLATTASVTAKLRNSRVNHGSVLYSGSADQRIERLMASTISDRKPTNHEQQVRHGALVEALMRWTQQLLTGVDPFDVLETPFQPVPSVDGVGTPSPVPQEWKPIPRVRPVQLPGGYGLVARLTF